MLQKMPLRSTRGIDQDTIKLFRMTEANPAPIPGTDLDSTQDGVRHITIQNIQEFKPSGSRQFIGNKVPKLTHPFREDERFSSGRGAQVQHLHSLIDLQRESNRDRGRIHEIPRFKGQALWGILKPRLAPVPKTLGGPLETHRGSVAEPILPTE